MAGGGVEDGVLNRRERVAILLRKPNADRVGPPVDDERIGRRQAIENCGGVFGYLLWREPETGSKDGADCEAGSWPADGVIDAVLCIADARNLTDSVLDLWSEFVEQGLDRSRKA